MGGDGGVIANQRKFIRGTKDGDGAKVFVTAICDQYNKTHKHHNR